MNLQSKTTIRQFIREILTPSTQKLDKKQKTSLDTSNRHGMHMEHTLQETIDEVKRAQRDGMPLAKGERRIVDSASPASGRLLEAKAIEKATKIMKLQPKQRAEIILHAAHSYENKTKQDLSMFETCMSLPKSALSNLDSWVMPEYCDSLFLTDELSLDDINYFQTNATPEIIKSLEGYQEYREVFWQDIKTIPHAWIIFDEFKAFLKTYWDEIR